MEQIIDFIENITAKHIADISIAIIIIILFRMFSSSVSYIIIKMFNFKRQNKKKIKESAFFRPLKFFFCVLGIYVAFWSLKDSLGFSIEVMNIATKIFQILSVIVFAKGLAESFTKESRFVTKVKGKLNKDMEDSMFDFLLKIIRFLIYLVAGFIVITLLGINLNGLVAGIGIGGVIITLAAQDTAKNLIGGVVIFIDKPFVVGDWIELGTYEGTVEDITFRSTRVRTFENSVVNIPNSIISESSIINWSKMERRRYRMNLSIKHDTPLEKLNKFEDRVRNMLQKKEGIFGDTVLVKFDEIKNNGINVLVSSYTDSVDYPSYLSERESINYKIMKILQEEGIELAYDTKTIHVRN